MTVKDERRPIEEPLPDFRPPGSIFQGRCYICGFPCRGIVCGPTTCVRLEKPKR